MAADNLTGDTLAFTGDVKRNAKCAKEPEAFVFQNEICGITFKCFPLGFNINFGWEVGYYTYFLPAILCINEYSDSIR